MTPNPVVHGYIVPGYPHPLLAPERNAGWKSLRASFATIAREMRAFDADLLLLYSTQWISIIGHQVQADPEPVWRHVDPEWHELGDMPYRFRMDPEFAEAYRVAAEARGLHARTVSYYGFPIDTGTVVALTLLNEGNRLPASVVSCNMYADRAETIVLGKAARDALQATGKRAVAIAVTALSNRMFTRDIDPSEDRVSSLKDDEWNRKILELLGEGRLEDVSQLAREFSGQANGDQKMKAIWWLTALMGENNNYAGRVVDYQAIWGTGAAIVSLAPDAKAAGQLEFDEESVEVYGGDRSVLSGEFDVPAGGATATATTVDTRGAVRTDAAPRPVGAYAHARRVGDLLFVAGMGPRRPGSDDIPGGPVRDADGTPRAYDIEAQTRSAIDNVRAVLEAAGSSLDKVLDVTAFLIDMDRDFDTFNRVYAEAFGHIGATRTTLAVSALPTPIAVELKVIASA